MSENESSSKKSAMYKMTHIQPRAANYNFLLGSAFSFFFSMLMLFRNNAYKVRVFCGKHLYLVT